MPVLIDSHTHLDAFDFDQDRDDVIARARAAGLSHIVTIGAGYGLQSAERAVALTEKYELVYAAVGVHPQDAKVEADLTHLRTLATQPKVVAIGETGLDFYRDFAPRNLQEAWFRAQIQLAREVKKPLIIHSREAAEECLRVLIEEKADEVGGVFHCYSEDGAFAQRLEQINFMVSFPGSLTFKKADKMRQAARAIPLNRIMVETDAPYLAPEPFRGKRCETSFVVETAKRLALEKGISFEECAAATTANALRFFNLKAS